MAEKPLMNFDIDFSPLPDYVLVKTEGEASVEGFENTLKALVGSPKWKPGTKQLLDHRSLNFEPLSTDDIRRIEHLIYQYRTQLGNGACAFVVKGALAFGMARTYENVVGGQIHGKSRVFYDIDEAINWLKNRQ